MKNKLAIISAGLIIFSVSGCSFGGALSEQQEQIGQTSESQTSTIKVAPKPAPKTQQSATQKPKTPTPVVQSIKEFTLTAKQWSFSPGTITVNKGDKVILHVKSVDVTHGFSLEEFGVSKSLSPGKTVDIQFTADKKGTFSFFCNVFCGSGHTGMKGNLIVK